MDYEDLLLEKKDSIATITLNNPDRLNAFTEKMTRSFFSAVDEIAQDDEVRVVILTGAGRGFCSGADVSTLVAGGGPPGATGASPYGAIQVTGRDKNIALPKLNKPVIAAVNGACVGGGLSLALCCDIRIASETARFGVTQVGLGRIPDNAITFFLPYTIGLSKALEIMFIAEPISAAEAERAGIVSRVVAPDQLMKETRELAAKIASKGPISAGLTKRIVWRDLFESIARHQELEGQARQIAMNTEDAKEGLQAFREKRPPQFKGR